MDGAEDVLHLDATHLAEGRADDSDPLTLPPHGTEVFIGGLHRGVTEEQLRGFASEAGEVFSLKLLRDPQAPSQNRGYGFVTYKTREGALRAMDRFPGRELAEYPGHKVRVQPSQAKNRLFVGGLPHAMSKEDVQGALEALGIRGLTKVELAASRETPGTNRGFGFLEFHNATCAGIARSRLGDPSVRVGDRPINVDYAEATAARTAPATAAVHTIFVGSLPATATEEHLREAFIRYGEIERVHVPRPKEGAEDRPKFGFVTFSERLAAAQAVDDPNKPEIEGIQVAVKYGRSEPSQHALGGAAAAAGGRGGGGGYSGGRGGGYGGQYDHQQYPQQYPQAMQQGGYGGMGGAAGYGGGGGGGMMLGGMPGMPGGGMVAVVPVQLPNGQVGYMMQPGGPMMGGGGMGGGMDDGGMGPIRSGGRGAWRGGGEGGYGGQRGGYSRGGGRGGRGGGQRYQPY